MNEELKKIKKIYGEEMMHLCREMFPTILEKEGLLLQILLDNLAPSHSFADDVKKSNCYDEFKSWIYSFVDAIRKDLILSTKTPFELMDEAGYILYECRNEEDIQKFRKYYRKDELICTITNGNRLDRCFVFFAVKKDVDKIRREEFLVPKREDKYGTSVISIQFARGRNNTLSIKNRYNHTVANPDSTFSNDLENIIPGLTRSFEESYNLNIDNNTTRQDYFLTSDMKYIKATDGKYYRYNLEIDERYYCENNIVICYGKVNHTYANNKERYLVIDEYLIDRKKKRIISLEDEDASFAASINNIGKIINIEVIKKNNNKEIYFVFENNKKVKIEVDKHNAIIGYENNYVEEIDSYFLSNNISLERISLNQVLSINRGFLINNTALSKISLPNVLKIGFGFLFTNGILDNISLPKVETIDDGFLFSNRLLKSISLPNVLKIGGSFMANNRILEKLDLPKVITINHEFLFRNEKVEEVTMNNVIRIGKSFMAQNRMLKNISLPKVKEIGDGFLMYNYLLPSITLEEVEVIGNNFLCNNYSLNEVILPNVKKIGSSFMKNNNRLIDIFLPNARDIGADFLLCNTQIKPRLVISKNGIYCINNDDRKVINDDKGNYSKNK